MGSQSTLSAKWYTPPPEIFLQKPFEGESFGYDSKACIDVCAVYRHLINQPERQVLNLNIVAFAPWLEQVTLDLKSVRSADISKAGIAITYHGAFFLIDGNHRMKRRLELGLKHMPVYLLDASEAQPFMTGELITI